VSLARRAVAELIGTAFLLIAVVGSGIMAERLSGGNEAIALLANAIATGGALVALILTLGPVSGAHLNPLVSAALAAHGEFRWKEVAPYACAQLAGALAGVAAAHLMFSLPVLQWSEKARPGLALMVSEFIATFGLLAVVLVGVRMRSSAVAYAVAAYITGAYWFTASTSFANPAVTIARSLTDTFSGIHPGNVAGFLAAQAAAAIVIVWLLKERRVE
jgi:glycerol uptake facilitator-like aquaporin